VIAFAGNVLRAKGVFDLIEAASAIKQHRPIVVFAGSGPDADDVGQAAIRNGIDVRFLGRLKQQDVARVFAAADIVTLPSYNEGLPNVVCEAMLCRRAIVATTVGGIPEIIENDLTGLLVEPGEPEQLARAFDRLASEEATRARLAEAAGNFAARRLTWRISALSYDNLYREMLDDVRPHVLETTV
jgi:glycosyltransferase involved in cell wall biosynthesis